MSKANEFKKELKALLKKYDATIGFNVGESSDTHGLYNERLEVQFSELREGANFKTVVETKELVKGWDVGYIDL